MQLLMITLLLIGLSNITGIQILTPMGRENLVLKSILWGAAVDFVLNLILIPNYASSGAAFATVMAELVKWLTHRIVAPACVGSNPIFRPLITGV